MEASNVKAMREALDFADSQLRAATEDNRYGDDVVYLVGCMRTVAAACRAALAAPQRNCDRFADELDAQLAFLNEVWLISIDRETMTKQDTYEKWTDEMRTRYGRWLLAPATEQKGDQL